MPCKWNLKTNRSSYSWSLFSDFKTKLSMRDKEDHYKLVKETTQQEDKMIINIYAPNFGAPKSHKTDTIQVKESDTVQ